MGQTKQKTGFTNKRNLDLMKNGAKYNQTLVMESSTQDATEYPELSRKRQRKELHDSVEEALFIWVKYKQKSNSILDHHLILSKAKELFSELGIDYEPDGNWLWRWCKRHNITFEEAQDLSKNTLPDLLCEYSVNNIFYAYEIDFNYKELPKNTTCSLPEEQQKKLTLLFITNALGNYKKVIAIGKSTASDCFQNTNIPLTYFVNENAAMTAKLWKIIILTFNEEIKNEKRKITLFVDKVKYHILMENCENIRIHYLTENTIQILKPLQGILYSFKLEYSLILAKEQQIALENGKTVNEFIQEVSILEALRYIEKAWNLVNPSMIYNCFKKVGFVQHRRLREEANEEQYSESFEYADKDPINCDNLQNLNSNSFSYESKMIKEIPPHFVSNTEQPISVTESEDYSVIEKPTLKDGLSAIKTLEKLCIKYNCEEFLKNLQEMENKFVDLKSIQKKITDYFK